ncbi:lipid A deacylase LpxR family protein [Haloferula rosea]|uniref:Lipid A deacylase LpxR family protein n=1 Tax=Haloferula rosea TaxID=490093 RepID=A0A934VF64_9BACT|nr:lipid A deacylase LpxR family protein [Haloferula rosea]MBK1826667.1 lipid A deacylase LpxR family protein [Haloferula rosea]
MTVLLLSVVGMGAMACAQDALSDPSDDSYLTFYLDNDLFGGTDRDYTNGARLSYISGSKKVTELGPFQQALRKLSGDPESFRLFQAATGFEDPKKIRYNYGFSLTQLMFTPDDPKPYGQPPFQRQYAGWLGLGFSLHVKDDSVLNSIEFTVGMVGEDSFAEASQDFIHDLRDIEKFNGWDSQIPNELTVDLSFVQKRRVDLARWGYRAFRFDGLTEWGVRLGSFRTGAHLGGLFRFGYNLPPDFSDPRLSPNAYSHRFFGAGSGYSGNWSVYLFSGATARYVAFDASLDGPLFQDFSTSTNRRPLVGEVYAGFGVRYQRVEISYAHTWRTEEYTTQRGVADFGSLAFRVQF